MCEIFRTPASSITAAPKKIGSHIAKDRRAGMPYIKSYDSEDSYAAT